MVGLPCAEGGVTERKVGVMACWSCSQPRSNRHRPPSIASPTILLRMSLTARGPCGRYTDNVVDLMVAKLERSPPIAFE